MSTATMENPFIIEQPHIKSSAMLAQNVFTLRHQRFMTMSELARKSGLSRQILYRVENGTANLRMDSLERIATALGVEVRELLG